MKSPDDECHSSSETAFYNNRPKNSIKQLYIFFCNNLYLGQFELARSCIRPLFREAESLGVSAVELLRDIVGFPFNRCVTSGSVSSPGLLAWMCQLELEKLLPQQPKVSETDDDHTRKGLEFNLLLYAVCANARDDVLKELYVYHRWIHSGSAQLQTAQSLSLSSALQKFLSTTLLQNPLLGHSVIEAIKCPESPSLVKNNRALCMVYIHAVNSLLDQINQADLEEEVKAESSSKLVEILSLFDPPKDTSHLPLRQLFLKLLECCRLESRYLSKSVVLSVLFGGKVKMLEDFCRNDYESEMNNAVASYQTCAELKEEQRYLLHLSSLPEYDTRLEMFFLLALKNSQHFLEAAVETSLCLIQCGMFEELSKLLVDTDLQALKPLLLLLGWTYCSSSSEARRLLDTLWHDKMVCRHPAISVGCSKLAYQIDLIQWCLNKTKPLLSESSGPKQQQAAEIFKRLENHSMLYVLHQSTQLSALDHGEVLDLLQKRPQQKDSEEDKKVKCVRFQDDNDEKEEEKKAQGQMISLDQRKDIAIYTAYCVLHILMETIMFCSNCADERISSPVRHCRRRRSYRASSSGDSSDVELTAGEPGQQTDSRNKCSGPLHASPANREPDSQLLSLYKENITEKLKLAKQYLAKLQPLTFRVEILENVFSLLFTTHEDIQENLLCSEYNSEEEMDDKSRHTSTDLGTPNLSPLQSSSFATTVAPPQIEITRNVSNSVAYDEPFEDPVFTAVEGKARPVAADVSKVGQRLEAVRTKLSSSMDKLNADFTADGRLSSMSENPSSMSTASSNSFDHFGFMVNEYLARDILAMLKDCLLDLQAAKFYILGKKSDSMSSRSISKSKHHTEPKQIEELDISIEEPLSLLVRSSVTMEMLQKKISQLSQYVSEAQWRFQLVAHEEIPRQAGEILTACVVASGESSDEEWELPGTSPKSSRKRRLTGKRTPRPEGDNDAYSDSSYGGEGHRRTRSRSHGIARQASHGPPIRNQGIVSRMLSSPVTLLNMSIRRGNFNQTKQIIKLCKLEERAESVEVWFSQAYHKASRNVQNMTETSGTAPAPVTAPGQLSMKSLANVAAAGVFTVSIATVADELLNFPTLPNIPELPSAVRASLPQSILDNFHPENLPVMVLLDLLVSSGQTWEVCSHLMDAIKSRAPEGLKALGEASQNEDVRAGQKKGKEPKIKGLCRQLSEIDKLLSLGVEEQFLRTEQTVLSRLFHTSTRKLLCQGVYPLAHDKCRDYTLLCQRISRFVEKVEAAFTHQQKSDDTEQTDSSRLRLASVSSMRSRVGSRQETPVLHHAMKQLIHVLEKEIPAGGVISLIVRSSQGGVAKYNNYLLSLYEHCKELAYLVSESESGSRETMTIPKNYFTMLEEGPIRILGRMMFFKKMQPERLKSVATNLNLNLTHIIVYSCCMKIPSKRLPMLSAAPAKKGYKVTSGKVVYNLSLLGGEVAEAGVQPEEVVRNTLTRLVALMKDFGERCNAQGLFDYTSAELMIKTAEYHDIIAQTNALKAVSLENMNKSEQRCFYGNLQNLMTVHCFLQHIETLMTKQEAGYGNVSANSYDRMFDRMTDTEQITWLNTFSYEVGQLGVISLFDLKYVINRSGLRPPSEWGRTLEHRVTALDESDPWFQLSPHPNPPLMFVMTSCCVSSPPLQVLEPNTVEEQFRTAMKTYLQMTVTVDRKLKLVRLPELLLWHRKDFLMDQMYMEYKAENEGLLRFLIGQLSSQKEKDLADLLNYDNPQGSGESPRRKSELPFDIEVDPFRKQFLCAFSFTALEHSSQVQNSEEKTATKDLAVTDTTYNLTPNTLDYVKSNFPLVATLVSLVCSDEFDDVLDKDFFDRHFSNSLDMNSSDLERARSPSSMSLVDIKSYRYEKLSNEYPTLKRHLMNYIIPLAATEDPEILKGGDPILKLLTSDIIEKFKSNMLSLHESSEFSMLLFGLLDELFLLRKWAEIIMVMDSVPVTVFRRNVRLQNLHDFVLCCLIHMKCTAAETILAKLRSEEVMTLIRRLICPDIQARELLTVYRRLHIDHNIDLYEMCLSVPRCTDPLQQALSRKFEEVRLYYRITECAKNLQFRLSLKSSEFIRDEDKLAAKKRHSILERFAEWENVVEWTKSAPKEILGLLIKAGDYETAKTWRRLHSLPDSILQEIEENHLISLLNAEPPNTTQAFLVLENMRQRDHDACLEMCQRFVQTLHSSAHVMFVASYMLNELAVNMDRDIQDQLRLTHIGARMLTCIPESLHVEYSHLTSNPALLLEQLIMNMKVDMAGKAYQTVSQEYRLVRNPVQRFTVDDFNKLVALYAAKALEFTVVQVIEGEILRERSSSRMSNASSDRLDDVDVHQGSPQLHPSFLDSQQVKRRSVDLQGAPRLVASAPGGVGSLGKRVASPVVMSTKFVMPAEPPSRDQWVADAKASKCMVCEVERFSMFNRRHHCRRCGRVVCAGCSEKMTPIKGVNSRTCDDCYRQIVKPGDQPGSADTTLMPHTVTRPGSAMSAFTPDNTIQEERMVSLSEVVSHTQTAWKLHTDQQYNEALREDFYFEQSPLLTLSRWMQMVSSVKSSRRFSVFKCAMAPSTSMCISILDLHGNPRDCGRLILKLCDDLSKFLKPIAPGVANPEVDYSLIMSMMKYLLFHAKIKFIKCGENSGMAQCDVYQGLVDLLGLLVAANFRDLPSIQELTKVDTVRRLRDKLISDERLQLAMEVSTKCGLDPSGVWVAWGMTCLQSGDFPGAREKFARCLRSPKDKNVCTPVSSSKVLKDIMEFLETMPATGSMELQLLMANPGSVKNLITTPSSTFFEETSMDSQQFQESVYYLKTYSSYLAVIDFHRRHGYWMKAVQYMLDHKCSVEVYIEGLLKPSLDSGELGKLTDQMLMIDPSLESWNPYLTATCRHLVKMKLHRVLYDFQLFMKDYIRAGMTCFTYFYQQNAQSYIDLVRNIQHLFTAQQHMQAYLEPSQWGNVPHPLSQLQRQSSWERGQAQGEGTHVRLVKSQDEVKRYIKTIALQIEVTKFLQACLTRTGEAASVAVQYTISSKSSGLPTLFATSQVRTDLVIMVLLSGENINQSFELANRIIKEYKLGAVGIYTHVAREMAKNCRYGDMRALLDCVRSAGLDDADTMDEIVGACLLVVADNQKEAKEAENIIKLLQKDSNKINAYILCGKLRTAYLMAVKEKRVEDVRRILRAAKSMGQTGVVTICTKWLEQYNKDAS